MIWLNYRTLSTQNKDSLFPNSKVPQNLTAVPGFGQDGPRVIQSENLYKIARGGGVPNPPAAALVTRDFTKPEKGLSFQTPFRAPIVEPRVCNNLGRVSVFEACGWSCCVNVPYLAAFQRTNGPGASKQEKRNHNARHRKFEGR